MIEFAIIGSTALVALAFLIQIGLRMNYQQEIEQQTFRLALSRAQDEGDEESQAILYQHIRDREIPDPSSEPTIMPRTSTQASSAVTWGEYLTFLADDRDSQARVVVHVNDTRADDFRSGDFEGGEKDAPLVSAIHNQFTNTGQLTQTSGTSNLSSSSSASTTLTLKNGQTVSGSASGSCGFSGSTWRCQ
ncbi:MAG: hypothetical protein HYZ91_07025 [Candidatus Omnitrophica bacterium]|nr:hypothetical protein [Candidatus Omnitrophota bacterium]